MYLIAETQSMSLVNLNAKWKETSAKTLSGAKRAAQQTRCFQGTIAHVATRANSGEIILIAHRINGSWQNAE
jgi:hypothetical protein